MSNTDPDQPKQISDQRLQKRLENKALHYLGRYSASTARLELILRKFAKRKIGEIDHQQLSRCIQEVNAKMTEYGYIDDARHIRNHLRLARMNGQSQRSVIAKLKSQGLEITEIERHIEAIFKTENEDAAQVDTAEIELLAALNFIKKKRLGCYGDALLTKDERHKQLARLARRGFSYAVSSKALDIEQQEEAEKYRMDIESCLPDKLV